MSVKISIVTPSFNQSGFLDEAIRSVIAQRQHIHEYFVMDGGSTDGSVEIIQKHAGHIDHWVSQPDGGQSAAIRAGFARATGDVLYWLNSDDVLVPHALSRVAAAFEARPECDLVSGFGVTIDAESRIVGVRQGPFDSPKWMRWGYLRLCQPCCFFRRRLYESAGGIDPDLHCVLDTELWYRMARRKSAWTGVKAYLAADRRHSEAKGATLHDRYRSERNDIKRRYPEFASSKWRHAIGHCAYYASQWLSGRTSAAKRDRRRFIGRLLDDVFPMQTERPVSPRDSVMAGSMPLA